MTAGLIAFSEKGFALGKRLQKRFEDCGDIASLERCRCGGLEGWTAAHFQTDDALIFIGACGIAVRAIAPHVKSKLSDPAVVVLDELGTFSVSLLSGHIGGGNDVAARIAHWLHAIPVITTATDRSGVFAIDSWAASTGLAIANPECIKHVSAKLLAGKQALLESDFPVQGALPGGLALGEENCDVLISCHAHDNRALWLIPPVVTLGVGCRKGASAQDVECIFKLILEQSGCHPAAVKQACSIDLKAQEAGLLEFCRAHKLPLITFPATELAALPGDFSGSAFVRSVTGVDNICERSAVLGSGGRLLAKKLAGRGVTMALAIAPYTVCFEKENAHE